jgi:hypothetical protein
MRLAWLPSVGAQHRDAQAQAVGSTAWPSPRSDPKKQLAGPQMARVARWVRTERAQHLRQKIAELAEAAVDERCF